MLTKSKVAGYLAKPFVENLHIFIAQWMCASLADAFYHILFHQPADGLLRIMPGMVMAYLLTFLYGLLKTGRISETVAVIMCILGASNIIEDIFCFEIMHDHITADLIPAVIGTNLGETNGFVATYLTWRVVLALILMFSSTVLVFNSLKRNRRRPSPMKAVLLVLLSASAGFTIFAPASIMEGLYFNKFVMLLSYRPLPNLDGRAEDFTLELEDRMPSEVVLIIGESYAKSHCGSYGYERSTTPKLDSMVRSGSVFLYENVRSGEPRTTESFAVMLTTADAVKFTNRDWLSHYFLPDIMRSAGYRTNWISNQSAVGVGDNVVAKIAEIADTVVWTSKGHLNLKTADGFDDRLLEPVRDIAGQASGKSFTVIHMMGQHEPFKSRYPDSFEVFLPGDKRKQSAVIAQYDNAVLFNDYVVSSLMEIYRDREAVVLYVPDHGLDIYVSDPEYAGHARTSNPVSLEESLHIPMYVFVSDKFKSAFPDKLKLIEKMSHEEFCTDRLMNHILEISGIKYK